MTVHQFPVWLSRFIGREKNIGEVKALLNTTRLLTITGPGGCGKTRLAVEVAKDIEDSYPDDIWLVDLTPLTGAEPLPQITAYALDLSENPGQPVIDRLIDHLRKKRLLLVLDNCEHLVNHCANFAHTLLAACPELKILATSREPLRIAGETTYLVPSLSLSEWQPGQPEEGLLRSEAVELFLDRARSIHAGFTIQPQNAAEILLICRQLDGIPLAIELAAGRMRVLSVHEIAERLKDTFNLLASGDRLAPSRQQTLKATLDWSHHLLQEEERHLFCRLAVFKGGFTLSAAEAVCAGGGLDADQILNLLSRLADKSFIQINQVINQASRYRLLEVIRQYGLEQLALSGEERSVRRHHLIWYETFAKEAVEHIQRSDPGGWAEQIEYELPNLRQAFAWARETNDVKHVHQLASVMNQFWQVSGRFREGWDWWQATLSQVEGIGKHRLAESFQGAGYIAQHMWDFDHAQEYMEKAIRLWEEIGDRENLATEKAYFGWLLMRKGNYPQAQRMAEESLAIFREIGGIFSPMATALMLTSDLAYLKGDYAKAEMDLRESQDLSAKCKYWLGHDRRVTRMAQISIALGDLSRARALLSQSLQASQKVGDRWNTAMILVTLVNLASAKGNLIEAARCIGATQAFLEEFGTNLWPVDRMIYEDHLQRIQASLDEVSYEEARIEGAWLGSSLERALVFASAVLTAALKKQEGPARTQKPNRDDRPLTPIQAVRRAYAGLTTREREVAALIAQGKSNADIAASLFLGVRTIETHVTKILNKLGYTSRTQIALWAAEKGLK